MSLPTGVKGDEDERVYNPLNGAYESAVRGAYEQFDSPPYLKGDDPSPYEKPLKTAFNNKTTAYTPDGKAPDKGTGDHHKMTYGQQVIELRSTFLRGFISEAHEVAAAAADDPASPILTAKAGKFGFLFRAKRLIPSRPQRAATSAGTIRQRLSPAATTPNLATPGAKLRVYNPLDLSFANNPPDFDRLTHYTSSSTVAIAWDLVWRTAPSEENAEYHLLYYHVQRQAIGDLDKAADSRRDSS